MAAEYKLEVKSCHCHSQYAIFMQRSSCLHVTIHFRLPVVKITDILKYRKGGSYCTDLGKFQCVVKVLWHHALQTWLGATVAVQRQRENYLRDRGFEAQRSSISNYCSAPSVVQTFASFSYLVTEDGLAPTKHRNTKHRSL